jgi:hypothetical protein
MGKKICLKLYHFYMAFSVSKNVLFSGINYASRNKKINAIIIVAIRAVFDVKKKKLLCLKFIFEAGYHFYMAFVANNSCQAPPQQRHTS